VLNRTSDSPRPHVWIALAVGAIYQLAALIIFRDILFGLPQLLNTTTVINGDELVPYFNPSSQLIDQAKGEYSELTNGYEFRVRYSFLTTWVRHYKVLPFAILFMLPTIVWGAYLTTAWFISRVFRSLSKVSIYAGTAFPTGLVYLIVTYAKITHFYTLIVGLCLMTISALVMLDALLFEDTRWYRRMVFSCLVVLFNPAVHYVILFALFLSLTVTTLLIGEFSKWIREGGVRRLLRALPRLPPRPSLRTTTNSTTGRAIIAMSLFVVVTLIPYGLFVKFIALRGVEDLAETVPGGYYFVRDASVSLVHILSWDLAGIMDKIKFGDYLSKTPRTLNSIYMLLALSPIAFPPLRRSLFTTRAHRQLLGVIYVNFTFAVWATVGYANPTWFPTFHRSMAAVTRTLYSTDSAVGDMTLTLSSTIVQVLRFPHRFQLILFMMAPLLMSLPIIWMIEKLHVRVIDRRATARHGAREHHTVTKVAVALAVGSVFFVPFFSNAPYREAFGSGNLNHFATPYPVGDLHEIKEALNELPAGKTVVFPPAETSKLIIDTNGDPHKFIDKFFIYYLDQPSYYYGLTGDTANKFEFFLILRGIYYQQDWWINVARDIEMEYIVLNKQVEDNRGVGAEYLPRIEEYLQEQLEAIPDHIELVEENDSFALYRLTTPAHDDREVLLFDTSWNEFLDTVFARLDLSTCYDFQYVTNYETPETGRVNLLASDVDAATIDVWLADNRDAFFGLSAKILPFNSDIVSSNYYLSPMFRLFLFFSDTKWNRTEMITPGIFGTMQGSFSGLPRPTQFTINTVAPEAGRYRVLLRAAAPANQVNVSAGSLDYRASFELRSPDDALRIFTADSIYEPNRIATDISTISVEELETRMPAELVPVNLRFVYHDLGVVDAEAGVHTFTFDKTDANPMLVEGIALIPEETHENLALPEQVRVVESIADLDCSEKSDVRYVSRNAYLDPAANGPHADLTTEELFELLGLEDLAPPTPGGIGGQWVHLLITLALVLSSGGVVHWRTRQDPDRLTDS
jgi:hypothetical protein